MTTIALPTLELRPPRVNAAGVCVRCLTRCGDDPSCVAWFASSLWMVCPECDGTNWRQEADGSYTGCGCWSGLVEACDVPLDEVLAGRSRSLVLVASA